MEDVLSTLSSPKPPTVTEDEKRTIERIIPSFDDKSIREQWKKLGYVTEYDSGSLFSGISESEGTSIDFIKKLINALINISKNIETNTVSKRHFMNQINDMVKSSLLLYQASWDEKSDGDGDDMKMIAAIHGFVNNYIKQYNLEQHNGNKG